MSRLIRIIGNVDVIALSDEESRSSLRESELSAAPVARTHRFQDATGFILGPRRAGLDHHAAEATTGTEPSAALPPPSIPRSGFLYGRNGELVNAYDFIARLPFLEAVAREVHGQVVEVWSIRPIDQSLRGVVRNVGDGRRVIGLNEALTCPLRRYGTLAHEIKHLSKNHVARPHVDEHEHRLREAECRDAGALAVHDLAESVQRRNPTLGINRSRCTNCYYDAEDITKGCPQGNEVLTGVREALKQF